MRGTHKKYRYPLRAGNQFKLLVDSEQILPAMLQAIESAREFILLEQYLFESCHLTSRFIAAFETATKRKVSVILLLDDFGSSHLESADRQRLNDAGVQLCMFNPARLRHFHRSLLRDHRKLLLVDGKMAFTGSAGFTKDLDDQQDQQAAWHEVMVSAQGPVVFDWTHLFMHTWQQCTSYAPPIKYVMPSSQPADLHGRVTLNAGHGKLEIVRSLLIRLRSSNSYAWITTPYFVASWKIRRGLRQAARRGIDVRLLLPGPYSDHPWISRASRRHYGRLLRSGVRIFEHQTRFGHAKIELCDAWVSIGSCNLDRWNQRWNLDANQEIMDQAFSQQVKALFESNFAQSREIHLAEWQQRPWQQRLGEWVSIRIVNWLEQHFNK